MPVKQSDFDKFCELNGYDSSGQREFILEIWRAATESAEKRFNAPEAGKEPFLVLGDVRVYMKGFCEKMFINKDRAEFNYGYFDYLVLKIEP